MSATNEKRYNELKQQIQDAKDKSQRARGALDQLLDELKEDYECESIEAAEKLLKSYKKEADEAEKEFETALEQYEEKWGQDD